MSNGIIYKQTVDHVALKKIVVSDLILFFGSIRKSLK